jgi:hypothetical protein
MKYRKKVSQTKKTYRDKKGAVFNVIFTPIRNKLSINSELKDEKQIYSMRNCYSITYRNFYNSQQ